ncbi:timeless-domain-containing protein, partial [Fistulina hepatica ATCC 64428]
RRVVLEPVVGKVVDALGGFEGDTYRLGDEVGACLKDLKRLWRKDDLDDERTVARIFWDIRVLPRDLIPILMVTAGKGMVEDKRAISCADLMTAMTWPIDLAEELKELDDIQDRGTDYTRLLQGHLHYKAALLQPCVMQALFGIMLPPLAKSPKERTTRDGQIVNVILHLIRNLAFIKDLPVNSHLSAEQAEFSSLQNRLVRELHDTHVFQLLLTIAANADNDPLFAQWNTLVLEIFFLLFRGVKPSTLAADQAKQPAKNLKRLMDTEKLIRQNVARRQATRHSRFGTTIAVKLNKKNIPSPEVEVATDPDKPKRNPPNDHFVLHSQQALKQDTSSIMDLTRKQRAKKVNTVDSLAREDNLSLESKLLLQNLAVEFLVACFNPTDIDFVSKLAFLATLLKDIRSERAKIIEKDNVLLLYVTKWFLEFFLALRSQELASGLPAEVRQWKFNVVAEVTERTWIVWVHKRMRQAVEDKPKQWTELQAGIECLTQLLLLIDAMSESKSTVYVDAASLLQQQLVYNGEILDLALDSLRSYTPGTQSLAYLDSSVHLAYSLLRLLERWGKQDVYVRKRVTKRKRKDASTVNDADDEEEMLQPDDEIIHETMFTFEAFQARFAHAEITKSLLAYLARYKHFSSVDCMRRITNLMHRQAVKAKAEGLFFNVSTLDLFKTLLDEKHLFPNEQPYKDLVNLIKYILRQFFKALAENPLLAVQAFFPKTRGNWKQFSSWESEDKTRGDFDTCFPQDVVVKKGYTWSEELGIAIAALTEAGQRNLVVWTTEILEQVVKERNEIIEHYDGKTTGEDNENDGDGNDGNDVNEVTKVKEKFVLYQPSAEAMEHISDFAVPLRGPQEIQAATTNPNLKLLFRLCKFYILDEGDETLSWYVPKTVLPSDQQRILNVVKQHLDNPMDLQGSKAEQLLRKKRRTRRRAATPDTDAEDSDAQLTRRKKRERKKKEKEQYKSAQFIGDSDEEYGDIEAFFEKEKAQRERMAAKTHAGPLLGTMRSTGTKKRRRTGKGDSQKGKYPKRHKGGSAIHEAQDQSSD